jgi:hypothetical protein
LQPEATTLLISGFITSVILAFIADLTPYYEPADFGRLFFRLETGIRSPKTISETLE